MKSALLFFVLALPPALFLTSTFLVTSSTFYSLTNADAQQNERASNVIGYVNAGQSLNSSLLADNEISHLRDVRRLLNGLKITLAVSVVTLALSVSYLSSRKLVARALFYGNLLTYAVTALLSISLIFFDSTFEAFHRISFPAGSYLFPPDSLLLQLFTVSFFQKAFAAIVITALFSNTLLTVFALAYRRRI